MRKTPIYCFIILSLLVGCTTTNRNNQTDGTRQLSGPELEHQKMAQSAIRAEKDGDTAKEKQLWLDVLKKFPRSSYGGRAHLRLGMMAYQDKDWKTAQTHFKQSQKMSFRKQEKQQAAVYLASTMQNQKNYKEAKATLTPLLEDLSDGLKPKAYSILAQIAAVEKDPNNMVKWKLMQLSSQPRGDDNSALKQEIVGLIQKHVPPTQMIKLHKVYAKDGRFPSKYLAYFLAQHYKKEHRYQEGSKLLEEAFGSGTSHPIAEKANSLLANLKDSAQPIASQTIGIIYPETGRAARIAPWFKQGIELAMQKYPNIQVIFQDSGTDPEQAVAAVETLAKQHKVVAILGPLMKATSIAAAKKAQELGVPMFSITASEDFAKLGSFIFRNNITLSQMARATARYAYHQLKIRRFGVFYPRSKYGETQANAFTDEVTKLGATVSSSRDYRVKTSNYQYYMRPLLGGVFKGARKGAFRGLSSHMRKKLTKAAIKERRYYPPFEGLYIPDISKKIALVLPHLAFFGVGLKIMKPDANREPSEKTHFGSVQLLGNNGWNNNDLFQSGSQYVKGGIFCVRYDKKNKNPLVKKFVTAFRKLHKKTPIHVSAYAYDTAKMVATLLTKTKYTSRVQFRDDVMRVRDFPGVTGKMSITEDGEIQAPFRFLMAYYGRFRYLGTASDAQVTQITNR